MHFWPEFSAWLDALPDTRFAPFIEYDKRFLVWWGLLLFCCKLGSRRQLDFDLRDSALPVLANVNRLAATRQRTLPVHDTLDHFLRHLGSAPLALLRTRMLRRLVRMKALDGARLLGRVVIAIDGTGHLHFARQHCPQCLVQHHDTHDVYLHMIEEAKLVGPGGMALSIGTAFIENTEVPARGGRDAEAWKQDCEVTALRRLLPALKGACPQTPICLTGDALYACRPIIELVEAQGWTYVFTFKPGRLPAAWADFQAVLGRSPEQTLQITLPDGTRQVYRWASGVTVEATNHRLYSVNAVQCEETTAEGKTTTFAWITNLPVTRDTVGQIAMKGGRCRWTIENQGFNLQKTSELHLEHAYSTDPDGLKAYYYLLQIAHIMLQLLEHGSLLRQLAATQGKTVLTLFGSLKNIARRLLEDLRHGLLPEEPRVALQIRLDTS
ncbi:MAG: hypothetical protein E6H04_12740 [Bacillati bacterium ANGP1]|uniref:Transposase n=1 Tax=Candidatus Segetimicrobium genomatis TaxID=2569760 RepID=A0A537J3Z4_9BACT|nr:MAG: hypothetical protein E6H04_12740 [Terrabacteria group bacterium ANGP1]